MIGIKLAFILFVLALFSAACERQSPNIASNNGALRKATSSPPASPTVTPDLAAQGKEIFAENCMICHKENATGGPITINGRKLDAEDLTTAKMKALPDDKLVAYVTNGIEDEGMPAFKDKLTPNEIRQVVAHIRTLQVVH